MHWHTVHQPAHRAFVLRSRYSNMSCYGQNPTFLAKVWMDMSFGHTLWLNTKLLVNVLCKRRAGLLTKHHLVQSWNCHPSCWPDLPFKNEYRFLCCLGVYNTSFSYSRFTSYLQKNFSILPNEVGATESGCSMFKSNHSISCGQKAVGACHDSRMHWRIHIVRETVRLSKDSKDFESCPITVERYMRGLRQNSMKKGKASA